MIVHLKRYVVIAIAIGLLVVVPTTIIVLLHPASHTDISDGITATTTEVAQDFTGEADPARMTLGMKKWIWVHTLYSDGTTVTPKNTSAFTLNLSPNGAFSATTDCNSISGMYSTSSQNITFGNMASTLMYCADSQETQFSKMLTQSQSYLFTSKGELVLNLKMDSGSVVFR